MEADDAGGRWHGATVKLAIEVADSSFGYDTGRMISIYAAFGVREVWVVHAPTLVTHIFRRLGAEGYTLVTDHEASELLTPVLSLELAVRLSDLGLLPIKDES